MPQETNLNVTPYFDDYLARNGGKQNNYYKVLFKPGYPVQARELTTLQSILQNQIEQFGNHIFKEGSVVIPGQVNYLPKFPAVEVEAEFLGIPLRTYAQSLIGKEIVGDDSDVRAKVIAVRDVENSPRRYFTLYVTYTRTGVNGASVFANNETLLLPSGLVKGALVIQPNQGFAITASQRATSVGTAVAVSEGVYFVRGTFVDVDNQLILLDPYSNKPNYKVGFDVIEEIITVDDDPKLADNARGFNNYAAPGADRFKISLILTKKDLDEEKNESFVQLLEIRDGKIYGVTKRTNYSLIRDELARRTFDESGDYYVKPFDVVTRESLDDLKGNNGIFKEGRLTYEDNKPSDDLGVYQISPGKAYVKGYEIETISPTFLDFPKPRKTRTLRDQSINYLTGPALRLNNVNSAPDIGIATSYTLSLRNTRVGVNSEVGAGKEIGLSRVYDFALESGSYDTSLPDTNQWDISLFDTKLYTELRLNTEVTLSSPLHILGKASGANGFLRFDVSNSGIITAYDTKGTFIAGEELIFNGIESNGITTSVLQYKLSDVKSLYGVSGINTFTADAKQEVTRNFGQVTISAATGGISTVTSSKVTFPTKIEIDDLVSYTNPGFSVPSYAKVTNVYKSALTIEAITSVSGVCTGGLPTSQITPSDFSLINTKLLSSPDNTLFTKLPKNFVSSVNLSESNLTIRKQFTVSISANKTAPIIAGENETFLPFDEERYVLVRSNGNVEALSADKLVFANGSKQLEILGLASGTDTGAKLIATLRKINVKSKLKLRRKVTSVVIDKSSLPQSGIGQSTLNDGLTYGTFPYGTRVQDKEICLQYPDIVQLHGVYESTSTTSPVLTRIRFSAFDGPSAKSSDLIVGEEWVGARSSSIGLNVGRIDDETIEVIRTNRRTPLVGERIKFKESGVTAIVEEVNIGDPNITSHYVLDNGQEDTIYDYGKIVRRSQFAAPTRKIRIVFESAYYSDSDDGDITTAASYSRYEYDEIPFSDRRIKCSDLLDIRPRVQVYTPTAGSRSPFEFLGRSFVSGSNNSSKNILVSDESILLTYSHYLSRIDRIYLSKDGEFTIVRGTPAEFPKEPLPLNDALEVAKVTLPPYLSNANDAQIKLVSHKRYRMTDIAKLDDRISNLEYYTTLSLLESQTQNLFVPDSNGLNRFKSGFFVDNFSTANPQAKTAIPRNAIDVKKSELRPATYTTQLDLILGSKSLVGIGSSADPTVDSRFVSDIIGSNIRKTGQLITLNYSDARYLRQPYATRAINVTPYAVTTYEGTIELEPSSDIWIDTTRIEANTITIDTFTPALGILKEVIPGFDPQTGFGPTTWNAWNTVWTGSTTTRNGWIQTTVDTGTSTRTGTRLEVTPVTTTQSLGDKLVDSDVITNMRSRNIEVTGNRFKPFTQLYAFFDGTDVNAFVFPKLIEIKMIKGTFRVGETVTGDDKTRTNGAEIPKIKFRVANANHKYGAYNKPEDIYDVNPYTRANSLPANYSSTSTILNVDTYHLTEGVKDGFDGYIAKGMRLKGGTSGAVAEVTNVRLVTDDVGTIIASFFIPDPNIRTNPKFKTGIRTFRFTNSSTNSTVSGILVTSGEEQYFAQGTLNTVQETIQSTRSPRFQTKTLTEQKAATRTTVVDLTPPPPPRRHDPLAQSFYVDEPSGIFVTKIDLYFQSKDPTGKLPLIFQLRTMSLGVPTEEVYPFSELIVLPKYIKTSQDGSVATTLTFPSPVYLKGEKEHAIVMLSDSNEYQVWCSRIGEIDITTQSGPESRQVVVTKQPDLGSLFKSQNGSTWDPSQYEDLKYTLYRAEFANTQTGTVNFFNPNLTTRNKKIAKLPTNPIQFFSKKIRVSLASSINDPNLQIGNTIFQTASNATANYVGSAGSASGTLGITNSGIGYTPSDGSSFTYNNISLVTVTGSGKNATANITIGANATTNGIAIAATVVNGGTGYVTGDVLTVNSLGVDGLGENLRLTVRNTSGGNQLILDNVQGDFITGAGSTIRFVTSAGINTDLNSAVGGGVTVSSVDLASVYQDGLHFKVNHRNHGMHSKTNDVIISGVDPTTKPAKLNADLGDTSENIVLVDASGFSTFENVGIATTNRGYLLIEDEIISYSGVSGNTLTGVTRGIDNTKVFTYAKGTDVYKYETRGISLRRINKTHTLQDATVPEAIGLDYYWLRLNMDGVDIGETDEIPDRNTSASFPKLYINETKTSGGSDVYATQNIQFDMLHPQVQTLVLPGTKIDSTARTVSGTSVNNNAEISFLDKGFESVSLNADNFLSSPRLICSQINEKNKLSALPINKSFELSLVLSSTKSTVSPVIDLHRLGIILSSNRVNRVITNYISDNRTSTLDGDPTAFTYATAPITLELAATSIKCLFTAYVNNDAEIRALYSVGKNAKDLQIYNLFPGYDNLDVNGDIINPNRNSGLPNKKVQKSTEFSGDSNKLTFREYEFSIDKLPPFRYYSIKLLGTSTNSAHPPIIRDFRIIALA
jgi:hypothetical protein